MESKKLIIINIILLSILIAFLIYLMNETQEFIYNGFITFILTCGLVINGFILFKEKKNKSGEGESIFTFSKDVSLFNDNNEFKNYVYTNFCQCANQCIGMNKEVYEDKQSGNCSEIILNNIYKNTNEIKKILYKTIKYFEKINLLNKFGIKYYINDNNAKYKFNWENIKHLHNKENQELFWLFRKLIVDGILKGLISKYNLQNSIQIYSVGSTKITSDYDITLYGNNNSKIIIINKFQKIFKSYFSEDSSIVFDTNIYGKAYISFNKEEFGEYSLQHNCGKPFYYLKETPKPNNQLMWGLIKYFRDIKEGLGEEIFTNIYEHMNTVITFTNIINDSYKTLISLLNKDVEIVNYVSLMNNENKFLSFYENKLLGLHDLISIINFYGMETYFTRGAFLDTVVNTQMCGNNNNIDSLLEVDYLTSILENSGFFFIHSNKPKYIIRVYNTYNILINKYQDYLLNINFKKYYNDLSELILSIDPTNSKDYDSYYCKNWISDNGINLNKCHKFKLYDIILNLILHTIHIYIDKKKSNIDQYNEFYNMFIIQPNEIFGEVSIISKKTNVFNRIKSNKIIPVANAP